MFNKLLLALFVLFIVALLGWCSPQCSRQPPTASIDNGSSANADGKMSDVSASIGSGVSISDKLSGSAADQAANTAAAIVEKGSQAGAALAGAVGSAGEAAATAAEKVHDSLKAGAEENEVEEPAPRPEDFAPLDDGSTSQGTSEAATASGAAMTAAQGSSTVDEQLGAVLSGADDNSGTGSIVLEGVTFQTNSDALTSESMAILDIVVADLQRNAATVVEIAGYTDNTGDPAYNVALSQRRAQAVVDYLSNAGVSADRLTAKGYGGASPVADNATAAGRAKNRRVELHVVK